VTASGPRDRTGRPGRGGRPGRPDRPVRAFGDTALVAEVESVAEAHALAAALARGPARPGVEDVVVGYRSVTVVADPTVAALEALEDELATTPAPVPAGVAGRVVEVPVAFDGPDLAEVAARAGMVPAQVVEHLTGTPLPVAFLGFLPGFAYLHGLPAALAGVPRRSSPRAAVPAGSVGVGGGFAGIYPRASPGGWQLVGRTGFVLFDPETPPFATLGPGDTVRLRAVDDPGTVTPPARPPLRSAAARTLTVEAPGFVSTVQDRGRVGVAALGVPRAGAADPFALRAGNRLVGNDDACAGIEVTALGPSLRFSAASHVAVVGGAAATVDGRSVSVDAVVPISAGQVLTVTKMLDDLRVYVVVSGGVDAAPVLGSRSSDVLGAVGPGPLRPGDVLGIGPPARPRGRIVRTGGRRARRLLRVVPGPDDFGDAGVAQLAGTEWQVAAASDRVGVRLDADRPLDPPVPGIASRGVVTGAVQVPADGRPVVLLNDHATVGGYPVVATVVSADLGQLGQCRPGDLVRFEPVDGGTARAARAAAERALERAVVGWYPVQS